MRIGRLDHSCDAPEFSFAVRFGGCISTLIGLSSFVNSGRGQSVGDMMRRVSLPAISVGHTNEFIWFERKSRHFYDLRIQSFNSGIV